MNYGIIIKMLQLKYFYFYNFLDDVTENYKNKNILIVTHGGATVAVKCYFEKYHLEELVGRKNVEALKNCEIIKFLK